MPSKAKRWCFTLNNPTQGEEDLVAQSLSSPHVKYGVYGRETGESGTPHLQGYVIFVSEKRLSQAKALLASNRVHLEVAKGTPQQASDYCKKDGDWKEFGKLPTKKTKQPQWESLVKWIIELREAGDDAPSEEDLYVKYPGLMGPQRSAVLKTVASLYRPPSREIGLPRYGWQRELVEQLDEEPDDRSIRFIVDPEGNNGKSWMCRYFKNKYPEKTQILQIGKRDDLAHALDPRKSLILFDIPRRGMEYLQYNVLEMLKNGEVFSPKYDSGCKSFPRCHVVVFCNESPDMNAMTLDRYKITRISQNTFNP